MRSRRCICALAASMSSIRDLTRAVALAEQIRSVRLRAEHAARVERLLAECPDAPAELLERIERLKKGIT